MQYTRSGKPRCFRRGCRRVGLWRFRYRVNGNEQAAYYCEQCAGAFDFILFGQPLQRMVYR